MKTMETEEPRYFIASYGKNDKLLGYGIVLGNDFELAEKAIAFAECEYVSIDVYSGQDKPYLKIELFDEKDTLLKSITDKEVPRWELVEGEYMIVSKLPD